MKAPLPLVAARTSALDFRDEESQKGGTQSYDCGKSQETPGDTQDSSEPGQRASGETESGSITSYYHLQSTHISTPTGEGFMGIR